MENDKVEVLAVIPARGGSKGVPRKNIRLLDGKPLIAYTIEAAKNAERVGRVIVSTDDEEIAEIAKKYGAEVPFMRPAELSGDDVPHIPDIPRHALIELEKQGYKPDIIISLEPTYPFRNEKHVDSVIKKLIESRGDWAITIAEVDQHPFRMRKLEGDRILNFLDDDKVYIQRQDFPSVYYFRGAVYAAWRDIMLKGDMHGKDWRGVILSPDELKDIDNDIDFLVAEAMMKKSKEGKMEEGKGEEN